MPDALLARARAGDANAFADLVRAHQGSVFSIGYRMLNRRDAAEDLAQDVFLQLYRRLGSIESLEHLGFLIVSLNARHGWSWSSGWKLLGDTGDKDTPDRDTPDR